MPRRPDGIGDDDVRDDADEDDQGEHGRSHGQGDEREGA